jgi:hypothetical protein
VTISSARAPDFVRALATAEAPDSRIVVGRSMAAQDVRSVLPAGATVVVAGPARHFLESAEQRLARGLANGGFDVVFVATRACPEG